MKKEQRIPVEVVSADPKIGLTTSQVVERAQAGWISGEPVSRGKTTFQIYFSNIFTFFNLIFVVLATLLLVSGSSILNVGFLIGAVFNSAIGIIQELKAKESVDNLNLVARHCVRCIRDGKMLDVTPDNIVRDDIAEFAQGDQLCADGILRTGRMWVDESQITGEQDSVEKNPGDSLHSGSVVLSGRGLAQLTAVGEDSEAASLAREAKKNPMAAKSEMMRSLDRLILFLGLLLLPIGLCLFYQEHYVLQLTLRKSAEGTVAALIGMIPEGLYVLTTVAIAVSCMKLSQKKVLVQDRNCIEALARVDVLCVDKTGTITQPDMEVEQVLPLDDTAPTLIAEVLTALYAAEPDNATAKAIHEKYSGGSSWYQDEAVPFSPETKWSGASFRNKGSFVAGAPEFLLGSRIAQYAADIKPWADRGYRVLLVAEYTGKLVQQKLDEDKLIPLALVLLTNRLRPQAKETFAFFQRQDVAVKVISGDNPATVSKIAMDAEIPGAEHYLDTTKLETDEDFDKAVADYTVFGRVTPQKKKKLVQALQRAKHTVAMTGDGVNDLLAMKQADCSVAMGSGAEAASHMASLVLLDNDFSAMPAVVAEGRRVVNNIKRSTTLFLVKNIFSLFLSIITLYTTLPYPLQPIHLSVISWMTIGIPAFLMTLEPSFERIQGHFLRDVLRRAFPGGLTNVFVVLVCQAFMVVYDLKMEEASTVCTALLCFVGLLVLYRVCQPFNFFRKLIWGSMIPLTIFCFLFLGDLFYLTIQSKRTLLVMMTLLLMTPTVFTIVMNLFDLGDHLLGYLRKKLLEACDKIKLDANL